MMFVAQPAKTACGAKTRAGGQCRRAPMANGRCNLHGGKSLAGLAHPNATSLRYSKVLPERLLLRYQTAAADRELLVLREEIALVDARIEDLIRRVETGESGELWRLLQQTMAEAVKKPLATPETTLALVMELVDRGVADYQAWDEVSRAIEQRRRLAESERKRLVEAQQIITIEQSMALLGAVVEVVRDNIHDRKTLATISEGIRRLMARNAGG